MVLVKARVEGDLGPVFPRLQLSYGSGLPDNAYQILVQDVPVAHGVLRPGWWLVDPAHPQAGSQGALPGAEVGDPFGPFPRVVWVPAPPQGVKALSCEEAVGLHVEQAMRRHVTQVVGLQEVQRLLQQAQRDVPELAAEVARVVPAQRVADVLKRLLQEGIPVRNLHAIFESLVNWAPKEADPVVLAELVRIDLGRYITARHVGPRRELKAILFESSLMERVRQAVEHTPRGNLLLLHPAVGEEVREQVRRLVGAHPERVVALTAFDVRRYIKTLIEPVAPQLPVLSYQEVDEDVTLEPVGWVTNPREAIEGSPAP